MKYKLLPNIKKWNFLKLILKFSILTFVLSSAAFGQIPKEKIDALHLPWIKFNWLGDSLGNKYFDKLDIAIPFKIDSLPYAFNAQLDLGAVSTMLYGKSIVTYFQLSPELKKKLDTTQKNTYINSTPCPSFNHINLTLDKVSFPDISIANYTNFGDPISPDSAKSSTPKLIGTIAPDLFQDKILIIDYPNQRICVLDSLPLSMEKKVSFAAVKIRNGRIKIPFTINAQQHDIMFDTGSSIFPIYTSVENSAYFTTPMEMVTDTIIGQSWGQKAAIYGKKISTQVKLGKHKMPPATVYYKEDKGEKTFEDEEKIIGLTGNAYFLNNVIIIDYKNKRFGVI